MIIVKFMVVKYVKVKSKYCGSFNFVFLFLCLRDVEFDYVSWIIGEFGLY